MAFRHVPASRLHVSEPDPAWFGNPSNEPDNPRWDAGQSTNWLKSRFHMSFAEYSNPRNSKFGVLRVMNDDFVQPDRGFGTHSHQNMEIITYIVQGKLTHEDSMGTSESLGRGSVQFMTAGRGLRHSEFNHEKDQTLRFIQTWIVPRKSGLPPNYGSFDPEARTAASAAEEASETTRGRQDDVCSAQNTWRHLVSDVRDIASAAPVKIHQDANLYVAELDARGRALDFELKEGRMAYVLCVEGAVALTKEGKRSEVVTLQRHDACEVQTAEGGTKVTFEAAGSEVVEGGTNIAAHVMIFEMARVEGAGRSDL